ncbi:hypothetical protein EDD18DRAFT_1100353 [Armillaria luteobubalina]|uniref:Uncharacterized protein n=1 Tax=Armillaria luteobubalina TaxID=153913 RepID=A0AA39QIF5_9AGAR|nr:hypothetical protein EDD18DRAFT_1100353 [Armillaria luteobubalina]
MPALAALPPHHPTLLVSLAFFPFVHLVVVPLASAFFPDTYGKMGRRARNKSTVEYSISVAHVSLVVPLALCCVNLEASDWDRAFGWEEDRVGRFMAVFSRYEARKISSVQYHCNRSGPRRSAPPELTLVRSLITGNNHILSILSMRPLPGGDKKHYATLKTLSACRKLMMMTTACCALWVLYETYKKMGLTMSRDAEEIKEEHKAAQVRIADTMGTSSGLIFKSHTMASVPLSVFASVPLTKVVDPTIETLKGLVARMERVISEINNQSKKLKDDAAPEKTLKTSWQN